VIIVGGGGHGLATAYYLAKQNAKLNIAVIEKGWLGGGNTGRNTTIVRSNYLWDEAAHLYEHATTWCYEPRPQPAGHEGYPSTRECQQTERYRR